MHRPDLRSQGRRPGDHSGPRGGDRTAIARALDRLLARVLARVLVLAIATIAFPTRATAADPFPSRPVRFVVAFSPGGIADTIARAIGQKMSERIGQPVVVETKTGAGGTVGARYVAAAAADGYTVLVTTTAVAINAGAPDGVHPTTQLTPVAIAARTPTLFATRGTAAARDLMAFVRGERGGRFTYASAGIGSAEHLAGEILFHSVPGLEATHVPFQGGAQLNTALVSEQVDLAVTTLPTALAFIRQKTLRVLAVASHTRMALLPDAPTLAESGFPDMESASWIGFFGPAHLPARTTDRLHAAIDAALAEPEVRTRLSAIGLEPLSLGPAQFAAFVSAECVRWAEALRVAGMSPR